MSDDVRKLLFFLLAVAIVVALLIGLVPRWLGAAAGPEVEILSELKNAESLGLTLEVPGVGTLVSSKANFQRMSVTVTGERAVVTATLDFDGKVNDTAVSSLGHERVPFVLKDGQWQATEGLAPRLTAVVQALEQRRRAIESGNLSSVCFDADAGRSKDLETWLDVKHRSLKATAWLMRSERDDVMVSEDYRLRGELPERPVDDIGTRRLSLVPGLTGFCFADGL